MSLSQVITTRPYPLASNAATMLHWLERGLGALCAAILAVLLAVVLSAVVLRYGFGSSFLGSDELAIWLHVALVSAGAPLAINSALAMRLDVFTRLLQPAGQAVAQVLADSFVIVGGLVLSFGGSEIVALLGGVSPTLGLPEWVRFALLGVGGALTVLVVTLKLLSEKRAAMLVASLVIAAVLYFGADDIDPLRYLPPSVVLAIIAFLGLVVAAPLPHAFLAAAYLAIPFGSTMPEPAMVASVVSGMSKFLLLAIPFFLLAGGLLMASGVAGQLVRFASSLVGHRRRGAGPDHSSDQRVVFRSVRLLGRQCCLRRQHLPAGTGQPRLSAGTGGAIIAATSVLDNVIPPSIAFLILAAATNLSVGSLLAGGFVAGAVMAVALAVAIHLTVKVRATEARATA